MTQTPDQHLHAAYLIWQDLVGLMGYAWRSLTPEQRADFLGHVQRHLIHVYARRDLPPVLGMSDFDRFLADANWPTSKELSDA